MPLYRVLNKDWHLQPFRSTELGTKYLEQDSPSGFKFATLTQELDSPASLNSCAGIEPAKAVWKQSPYCMI